MATEKEVHVVAEALGWPVDADWLDDAMQEYGDMSIGEVDQKLTSCRSIFEDCGCRGVELALLGLRMF